jgi:hypothetical protein
MKVKTELKICPKWTTVLPQMDHGSAPVLQPLPQFYEFLKFPCCSFPMKKPREEDCWMKEKPRLDGEEARWLVSHWPWER